MTESEKQDTKNINKSERKKNFDNLSDIEIKKLSFLFFIKFHFNLVSSFSLNI